MTHEVFLEKIRPFQDKIYRFARRLLISQDEAQDASQEVLLKLWKQHQLIDTIQNLEAYAMRLTKNWCFDKLKSKNAENISLTHYKFEAENDISLQKQIENKDMLQFVKKCIDELTEQQRMVIQLRDIECYTFEEIEKITEIKEATLRVILSRARKTIREKIINNNI
ncbi:MAG: RNA polymerase sigma factor [Capnocytophaga sp.]|nr:RNA polymerase sigma factor [Capnocytophaga sp.]